MEASAPVPAPLHALLLLALLAAPPVPFTPGERLDFDVDYLGLRVGKVRLEVLAQDGPVLPVALEARTTGLASLFEVRDRLVTGLDTATLLPRWAELHAQEGGYRHDDRTDFDRTAGLATVREVGRRDVTTVVPVPAETIDFVGLVYRLRTLPLAVGQRHRFDVLGGTTLRAVEAEVVAREAVRTGAGTFRAVKVRLPTGFTGSFSEKRPTYLWFSEDARRILLRLTTEFRIGRATADLVRWESGPPAATGPP